MGVLYVILFRALPYAAVLWLGFGLIYRLRALARTPAPLPVELDPGLPRGRLARLRLFSAVLQNVFPPWRRHPVMALGSLGLHFGLLLALMGHARFFLNPVPEDLYFLTPLARIGGYLFGLGLALLAMRRLGDPRLWHLSGRADFGVLALLMALALSGLALARFAPPDPAAVKGVALGLTRPWSAAGPWPGWLLSLHLSLALALVMIFPFSKLMHGPELFFNPVRWPGPNSALAPRLNPWDQQYLGDAPSREAVLPGEPQPWTMEDYRNALKDHWSALGTSRVFSAAERNLARSGEKAK
jgi:nitrate reductase gamma subunit